jgi:hypothetical protein
MKHGHSVQHGPQILEQESGPGTRTTRGGELTDILYQSDREYNSTEVALKFVRSKSGWSRWGKIERSLVAYASSAPSL